jgi:hypothetical protein
MTPPPQDRQKRIATLCELLSATDEEHYEEALARCRRANAIFHQLMAESLAPVFNLHVAAAKQLTLRDKQDLAKRTSADLRSLDLAILCPRTGQAALLQGVAERDPQRGRFQLRLVTGEQKHRRPVTALVLPELELVHRRESLHRDASWRTRVDSDVDDLDQHR